VTRTDHSRRRLLTGLVSAPVALVAGAAAARLGAHAALARPAGRGTSTGRCGQCGSAQHTMLAVGCPAAPRVV
jgi:hypothetical protein